MIGAFNSVYTALQGFLSRTFWFAAFLPVALIAVIHLAIATLAVGPIKIFGATVSLSGSVDAAQFATSGIVIVLGLVIVAYAVMPLMPRFRGLLDGTLLPVDIHDWLRGMRRTEANILERTIQERLDDLGALHTMLEKYNPADSPFRMAYADAERLARPPDSKVVDTAAASLKAARTAIDKRRLMAAAVREAEASVLAMLARNNPDKLALARLIAPATLDAAAARLCEDTGDLANQFEDVLSAACREAFYAHEIVKERVRIAAALKNPRATLIGDARYVVESYAEDVYCAQFDFLWPRLLVAIKAEKADDPILTSIENARAQSDFAVLSLVLILTVPAIWLPTLLVRGGPAWLFLAIGAATPMLLTFFYELVFENQLAFGDVVKSTIDRHRLLVLKMLGLPQPASRSGERLLWEQVRRAEEDGRTTDLVYLPPKTQ
ncbi:hypothetical protein [Bradyrhizobium sp. MOS003]|uniref:hypothetical protein n=1 Tax=Bradyrhizobium sp. MOS003 TaxID=2133946 RepID=UPI000D118829|nr:hypothetical protein [Bradyrhizobium sp. MOS003]PSO15696.1 hypothetical protein C7G42_27095 [Bradyrhizobium sp. MOS003]